MLRIETDSRGIHFYGYLGELEERLDRAFEESKLREDRDREAAGELLMRVRLG